MESVSLFILQQTLQQNVSNGAKNIKAAIWILSNSEWNYSTMTAQDVQNEYDALAPTYDKRWDAYLSSTHKVALQLLDPQKSDSILDVSAGTGLLAQKIVPFLGKKGRLTLVDISPGMLKVARKRLQSCSCVDILEHDVHNLSFKSESFTKVLSVSALHYYKNPKKVLQEIHRVLQPKGALILVAWSRDTFLFKIFSVLLKIMKRNIVKIHTQKELKKLLAQTGFHVNETTRWSQGVWSLMAVKATKK